MRQGDSIESRKHHLCMSRADDPNGLEFSIRILQVRTAPQTGGCMCVAMGQGEREGSH